MRDYATILREPEPKLDPPENPHYEEAVRLGDLVDELTTLASAAEDLKLAFESWAKYPSSTPDGLPQFCVAVDLPWTQQIYSHLQAALDAAEADLRELEEGGCGLKT